MGPVQAVVFEDRPVNSALYTLKANGDFQLGDKVGSAGVSGLAVRTQRLTQAPKFKIECTGSSADDFKIYGASIVDAGNITLPADLVTREVLNTAFEACGKVAVNSCVVENCNFISSDETAAELPSGNVHKLKNSNFINNLNWVEIPEGGTYTYNYTGDMSVVLQIIKIGYVESLTEYVLGDSDQSVTVIISADTDITIKKQDES